MNVRYIGAHDRVLIAMPSGIEVAVARGETCEVPDDLGASLLEQAANWEAPKAHPAKAAHAAKED